MRQDLIKYIRTDKNGTKIFYDYNCPRCCGYGELDKWINTGKVCFACGGSGIRAKAKIVKEYTPEYLAKLEAKRIAKQHKYEEDHAAEIAAQKAKHEAEIQKSLEFRYSEFGCGKDGTGYVLTGNTFPIKDKIKAAGGRWIYGVWICPVEIPGNGIRSKKISLAGHIGGGSQMWLDDFDLYEAING